MLFDLLDREKRLIKKYQSLMAEGNRSTPGVLLKGAEKPVSIRSIPSTEDPRWVVFDGLHERRVTTDDIAELDAIRWLSGYDY